MNELHELIFNNDNSYDLMDTLVKELTQPNSDFETSSVVLKENFNKLYPALKKINHFFKDCSKFPFFTKLWKNVKECCHDNPDGTKMIFHLESRLDRHLVLSAYQVGLYCLENGIKDDEWIFIYMITALFHDIGKPSSECINNVYNHKSYKGHGWMGQIIWTKLMLELGDVGLKYLNYDAQKLVGRGIGYHMCGLHRMDTESRLTHMLANFMKVLPNPVQKLLIGLNHGDILGSHKNDFDINKYFESRQFWLDQFQEEAPLLVAYKDLLNIYSGIMITLSGQSGSGKSTTAKHIKSILGDKCVIIERDDIMTQKVHDWLTSNSLDTIFETLEKPMNSKNKRTKLLDNLNCTQEELDNLISNSFENKEVLEMGLGYSVSYMIYKELKLSKSVNSRMKKLTRKALLDRKIVIGDSMIYGTPDHKNVLPEELGSVLRINIFNVEPKKVSLDMAIRRGMDIKTFNSRMRKKYGFEHLSKGKNSIMEANLHNTGEFPKYIFDSDTPLIRIVQTPLVNGFDKWFENFIGQLPSLLNELAPFENKAKVQEYILDDPLALAKLLNPLLEAFEGSMDTVTEYLASIGYVIRDASLHEYKNAGIEPKTRFYLITYREGLVDWNTYYCHATRGAAFFVKDNKINVIKSGPPKSPEIQSLKTHKSDVSTQDSNQRLGYGHEYLQNILTEKETDANLNFTLSGKRDGSLSQWTLISNDSPYYEIIREHIMDAPLTDENWNTAKIATLLWVLPTKYNFNYSLILSSQNTLFVGTKDMMNWYLSAAILSTTDTPLSELKGANEGKLISYLEPFITKLSYFAMRVGLTYPIIPKTSFTISFEAICPYRTDPVDFTEHTELACSYDKAYNSVLGIRYDLIDGSIGTWIPHFDLQKELDGVFEDPLFWNYDNIQNVNDIFELLQTGDLSNFPKPNNLRLSSNIEWYQNEDIDPEGFILYSSGGDLNFDRLSSKLKDTLYYILHKLEKYYLKMHPDNQKTWQQVVLELSGWYQSRYPVVSRMQQAQIILNDGIPNIVKDLSQKYQDWFNVLETNEEGQHYLEITTRKGDKKIIKQRPGSIFQKPFVPLFINEQDTIDIIINLIQKETNGILGSNFMSEVKSAIMNNQDWLSQNQIDISSYKWKSMIEIAKMAHNNSIEYE